jgi:hypothetical protein
MDELRQLLHREANGIQAEWGLDDLMHRASHRTRLRRVGAGIVGFGGLAVVIALVMSLRSDLGDTQPQAHASSALSPAVPGTCEYGPWMEFCPEASWARSTLAAAGVTVSEETPAAFVVQHQRGELLFWAMDPANHEGAEPMEKELQTGDKFQVVQQIDGVPIYEYRGRWVWVVHGLDVWVTVNSGDNPTAELLETLVRASQSVPY